MGDLDNRPIASEQAEAARQGLAQQSGTTKHRLLMEGQEEPARLIAEFESIDQDPNMPPEEKRVRREAILLQLKKLKADELRNSGMFGEGSEKKGAPVNRGGDKERKMAAAYADLIDTSDAWRDGRNPIKRQAFMDGWEDWRKKLKALGMPNSHDILKISRKGVAQKDKESFEKWENYVKASLKKFAEGKGW